MDDNPYKAPIEDGTPVAPEQPRRRRTDLGYFLAVLAGVCLLMPVLMPLVSPLDDTGGTQLVVSIFVCVVIYRFLF